MTQLGLSTHTVLYNEYSSSMSDAYMVRHCIKPGII